MKTTVSSPNFTSYDWRPGPSQASASTNVAEVGDDVDINTAEFEHRLGQTPTSLFPMAGDKTRLLENPALSEPLLAAVEAADCGRFIDAFTGTTSTSLWLAKKGKLPDEFTLNETAPLRNIDINQSIHHPKEVNEKLRFYGNEIRQICYKILNDETLDSPDVSGPVLEHWEKGTELGNRERDRCHTGVKDYLMTEMGKQWDNKTGQFKNEPATAALHRLFSHNMFRPGTPVDLHSSKAGRAEYGNMVVQTGGFCLQMFGNKPELDANNGRVQIKEWLQDMEASTAEVSTSLKGAQVESRNGWKFIDEAKPGDVLFIDPPYLLKALQKEGEAVRYMPGKLDEYRPKSFCKLVESLEEAANRGVRIVMTNRFNNPACTWLQSRGWNVSEPIDGAQMTEMVVTNFDVVNGKPEQRDIGPGKGAPLANLPGAYRGRWQSVACELDESSTVRRYGIEIDMQFYTEHEKGQIWRYAPLYSRTLRNNKAVALPGSWQVHANQEIPPTDKHIEDFPDEGTRGEKSTVQRLAKRQNLDLASLEEDAGNVSRSKKRFKKAPVMADVPTLAKADARLPQDIKTVEREMQTRQTLLKQVGKQYDIGSVDNFTVTEDDGSWQCQFTFQGETITSQLVAKRVAENYLRQRSDLQALVDRLGKEPYNEATRNYINSRNAELTRICNARKNPDVNYLRERDALAELRLMSPDVQ
jgi:hypothetical protein